MRKIKVWEKPIIMILGVEETQDSSKGENLGPCLNLKHKHHGALFPMTPGHGYGNGMS